jgi:hypothetical protein
MTSLRKDSASIVPEPFLVPHPPSSAAAALRRPGSQGIGSGRLHAPAAALSPHRSASASTDSSDTPVIQTELQRLGAESEGNGKTAVPPVGDSVLTLQEAEQQGTAR